MLEIEKGHEVPKISQGRQRIYPFNEMNVGDSFFIPGTAFPAGAYASASRDGIKIAVRKVDGGHRVWRIA